jgi:hypothetical protein
MSVLKRCALALQLGGVVCLLFSVQPIEAATLTVGWDPSSAPGVAGYLVSYGSQPGQYTTVVDAGNQTAESISGLADGTTYYFAVRAYDAAGLKSGYSAEINGTTPVAVSAPQPPDTPGLVSPPSAATAVAANTPLMWNPSANALRYDVAFGTANPPPVVSPGQTGTAYQPPLPLMANTTYFWQVIASNAAGSTVSPVWTFTTAPAASASPTSPDGTIVSYGGQIVDATGAIWTIGSGQQILRNGTQAASGAGTKILWTLNTIYVLGTDSNWWKWSGSGWTNCGPTQPGNATAVTGASPDGAIVPPAARIVDAQGASWTIGPNGQILRNSTQAGNGVGSSILWWSANIYVLGTDSNWWLWHGDVNSWTNVGPAKPNGSGPASPSVPTLILPANGTTSVSRSASLSWLASTDATAYDVALGVGNPPSVVSSGQSATSYQPGVLSPNTTYFWQIVAKGAGGTTPGPIWSFTTVAPPSAPSQPAPADLARNTPRDTTITWATAAGATQYDVAFGTSNPPAIVASAITGTTYQPATLKLSTTYYWQVIATGAGGTTAGPIWSFTTPTIMPAAVFVGTDVSTQGGWKGLYGGDGYAIAADATSLPSYATVAQTGQLTWVWAASTSDARGLEKSAGTDRIASAWYGGSFSMDVELTDGVAHDVAIYVADYDAKSRAQTVQLVDPSTGAILDSRAMTAFTGGQYWVWNVRGRVTIVVTATTSSAVVSGIFFDSIGGSQNHPPVVAVTSPTANATFTAPATVVLGAAATDADGTVEKVAFYTGSTLIGTVTTAPFVLTCSNVAAGTYTVVAVATDNFGATTTSAPVQVTVNGAKTATTAAFVGTDTKTEGTWKGVYGSGGYALANDATNLPSYAAVSAQGMLSWTYATSTTVVSALQKATQPGRMAAAWYGGTMTLDLNLLDGAKHQVSLYLMDWDSGKRRETIQVVDAVTKVVLDSRSASKFQSGQYWTWTVSGHVIVQVINGGGASPNAVFSGVFFDK